MSQMIQARQAPAHLQGLQARRVSLDNVQLRFDAGQDGKPFTFSGYAVRWDSVNEHGERFLKGAFAKLIASGKRLHMYYNHSYLNWWDYAPKQRIGKWISIEEDDIGLKVTGELTKGLALAADVRAMLEHGTIDGLSICFYNPTDLYYRYENDVKLISEADAYEISVVDEPSDRAARIDMTAAVEQVENARDASQLLQKLGINPNAADALLARLTKLGSPAQTENTDPFAFLDDE